MPHPVKSGLDRGTPYPEEALYVYVYVPRKKIETPSNSWLTTNQDLKTLIKPTT